MEVINTILGMQHICNELRLQNKKIAVVPTMGYLHQGHISLIEKATEVADIVITTLFVNPTQFAPNEDFNRYPRDLNSDFYLAKEAKSTYLFIPDTLEMYPKGFATTIIINNVTEKFEGVFRPSHFQGVATVVAKLFNITKPDFAIFGQKDYQQTLLITKLIKDLNFEINLIIAPTLRESDGLAMSSRNTYLSIEERQKAGIIFRAIEEAKGIIAKGEVKRQIINSYIHKCLRSIKEIRIDYAAISLASTLEEPDIFFAGDKAVILIACYLGKTRLIDNSLITFPNLLNDSNFIEGI
ncbi:MAG TPA: pantoate--beta-alanine ligase [Candidatus Kapabacteria bacterium]|nr:pantoate--beta-alanine ligase [Candidatus Kapabacteria bacterium]